MKKINYVFRIIFLTIFIIVSTIYVYLPKKAEYAGALAYLTPIDYLSLESVTEGIIFTYPYPVIDEVGLDGYDTIFKVKNYCDEELKYQIKIETFKKDKNGKYLDVTNLKYSYRINDSEYTKPQNVNSDGIIDIRNLNSKQTNTYYIKFWVDINVGEDIFDTNLSFVISLDNLD